MQSIEEWRPVRGYENVYEVSRSGKVRRIGKAQGATPGMVLTPVIVRGYAHVVLSRGSRRLRFKVHRLVAAAFVAGERPGLLVCHNDGNPLNNRAENLRWDTQSGNMRDTLVHGTHRSVGQTECKYGHPLSDAYRYGNRRQCRTCALERAAKARGKSQ